MKSYSFYNEKEERWISGQYLGLATWLFLSALVITEIFIKKAPTYSIDTLSVIFFASLISLFISSYCKVKHAEYFNCRIFELIPNIDLPQCLSNAKKIAFVEEVLKANFINIAILILMTVSHTLAYRNLHINSLILLVTIAIQMFCVGRLFTLKSRQATLCFPEVKRAHQIALNERKKLDDAEKHLPWFKRTF